MKDTMVYSVIALLFYNKTKRSVSLAWKIRKDVEEIARKNYDTYKYIIARDAADNTKLNKPYERKDLIQTRVIPLEGEKHFERISVLMSNINVDSLTAFENLDKYVEITKPSGNN